MFSFQHLLRCTLHCLMELEIFAIRCFVRCLLHGVRRLGPPLVLFYLLRIQVKGSAKSPINGIYLPGRFQMSSVGHSNTQRVLHAWLEASLEDEPKNLSMPCTSPPGKCSQPTLATLSAFRLYTRHSGCHESCCFCITIRTRDEALRILGVASDDIEGFS